MSVWRDSGKWARGAAPQRDRSRCCSLIRPSRKQTGLARAAGRATYFVDQLAREIPFYAGRHNVKPGVAGWAQARHTTTARDDAAQKLRYDLYYVNNHTLFLDTVILFETVGVVLTGAGAH